MKNKNLCKNCSHSLNGKFCNQCGQSADTHKLSLHFIWHDLIHGILHFDNGIFFTIKQLLTRPGHAVKEFIEGKRVKHFKPFSFVIVLATIYGFLFHYLIYDVKLDSTNNTLGVFEKTANWTISHFSFAVLLFIISTTISSYFIFKKHGYNLAEHLILNTYYRGQLLLFAIIMLPVLYYIVHNFGSDTSIIYGFIFQFFDFISMYWFYSQFFNKLTKTKVLGLSILAYLLMLSINLMFGYTAGLIINYQH